MSNLVGNGLNQVPTNSMLGGLAYQDPEYASIKDLDLKNLSQINSEIDDTAVDVFVYDTRKDSDGGAWRKRTQHTSWYNETLNTSTRGSRKEFPAVAVIVTETRKVTIYDGDDPDLPMWMIFNAGSGNALYYPNSSNGTSTVMLNGKLANAATGGSPRFRTIDFLSDSHLEYSHTDGRTTFNINVSQRNAGLATFNYGNVPGSGIIHRDCNDVAMTVLPNAPIDDATGLPVPTIAVATIAGVSVIKDDGTVFDVIDSNGARRCYDVSFTKDHKMIHTGDLGAGSTHAAHVFVTNILTADRSEYDNNPDLYRWYSAQLNYPRINGGDTFATRVLDPVDVGGHHYAMADVGVSLIEDGTSSSYSNTDGMVAYITSDYNSGYQHGDIKGAFLSDTTVESLTANTNLASNCTQVATSRLTSETYDAGDTSWQMVDDAATNNGYITIQMSGLTIGQSYIVSMTWDNNATLDAGYNHQIIHKNGLAGENSTLLNHWDKTNASSETLTGVFVAQSVNDDDILIYANAITLNVSNFIVRAVDDEDRSVNNKGLQVFGTVTKTAVATGAELVAYSGFTASNYLQQPYNSDLDFGTGDFSIMFWYKATAGDYTSQCFLHRGDGGTGTWGSGKIIQIEFNSTNLAAFLAESAFSSFDTVAIPGATAASGKWQHYTLIRRGTFVGAYLDGELKNSTSSSRNLSNTSAKTWIGERPNNTRPLDTTSLALLRISKSAPSDQQIKKIYEDEKVLFQENAKATLYGSSDAVTALAYDDSTNLLYAGTSAGRSEFQGLCRINNTTTAVTTAISASNGLVAEQ